MVGPEPGRRLVAAGSGLALLGVAAGAFGAHALEPALTPRQADLYHTAARYHLLHALAVVMAGLAAAGPASAGMAAAAGWVLLGGTAVFSGTVYALALGGPGWLGAVTPIGGTALLVGWGLLAVAGWRGGGPRPPR
jgi:uncharacterized membrane protein YgdD (TMEM256/DUF423 family)